MSGNAEKTKFSIRVDTELLELADAYIRDSTVQNLSLIHILCSHYRKDGAIQVEICKKRDEIWA